jgi:hypothetical protein
METFRIEVGHRHGVKPGNIVGAIANEAELESRYIGRIDIRDDFSLIDLPEGMPREIMEHLKRVRVAAKPLRISRPGEGTVAHERGTRDDGDGRARRVGPARGRRKPAGKSRGPTASTLTETRADHAALFHGRCRSTDTPARNERVTRVAYRRAIWQSDGPYRTR